MKTSDYVFGFSFGLPFQRQSVRNGDFGCRVLSFFFALRRQRLAKTPKAQFFKQARDFSSSSRQDDRL
jgi:hypothetical protein